MKNNNTSLEVCEEFLFHTLLLFVNTTKLAEIKIAGDCSVVRVHGKGDRAKARNVNLSSCFMFTSPASFVPDVSFPQVLNIH